MAEGHRRTFGRAYPTKDGGTLRTIREACDYMTSMDKKREVRTHWQRACKLILAKEDVLTVSRALELALFMDANIKSGFAPAIPVAKGTNMKRRHVPKPTSQRALELLAGSRDGCTKAIMLALFYDAKPDVSAMA
jgi:hypothetical protein